MINRLTKLQIRSVDSVDRGAGVGCRVLIRKRHDEEENPMSVAEAFLKSTPGASAMAIAEHAQQQISEGRISEFQLNVIMKGLADRLHDGNMTKFLASEPGKVFLRPRSRPLNHVQNAELAKREGFFKAHGNEGSQQREYENPAARSDDRPQHESATSEPWDQDDFDKEVARLKATGLSHLQAVEQAATAAHRKEKAFKKQAW